MPPIVDLRAELYGEITPDHLLFLVSLGGSQDRRLLDRRRLRHADRARATIPTSPSSAGGFHPHYPPPGELAGMRRVSVDLSPPAILTLRAEAYLALTSNSFQLGTPVELRAEVAGVGAEGHLQFDALVLWAPTLPLRDRPERRRLAVSRSARASPASTCSLHLEGPGPWVGPGHAPASRCCSSTSTSTSAGSPGARATTRRRTRSTRSTWCRTKLDDAGCVGGPAARPGPTAGPLARPLPDEDRRSSIRSARSRSASTSLPLETMIDHIGAQPGHGATGSTSAPRPSAVAGLRAKAVSQRHRHVRTRRVPRPDRRREAVPPGVRAVPVRHRHRRATRPRTARRSSTRTQWDTVCPPGRTMTTHGLHALARGVSTRALLATGRPARPDGRVDATPTPSRPTRSRSADPGQVDGALDSRPSARCRRRDRRP